MDDGNPSTVSGARPAPGAGTPGIRLFERGTALGARFEIGEVRGVGGSAVVYSAFDRELRQQVALKVLRADRTSPEALTRLKREVAVARQAASPRLVRVYDIDASGESVFLTMEDVAGGSLKDRLAQGQLPLEETLRVAREVLEGLAVLHGLGIVHRDVKPGNVLLSADASVKLADFGLARRLEVDETRATSVDAVVGTVEYLSPEQALGRELDGRSDLYSFGVTLYEMAAGGVPFRRDSAIGTALAHVKDPPPRLRSVRPDAPAWLEAFVARLLAKAPEERYATAEEALADLAARRATVFPGRGRASRRIALAAVAGAAAILAALFVGPRLFRPRVPVRIATTGQDGHGIVAIDARGRALWSRRDVWTAAHATIYRRGDGSTGVAAALTDSRGMYAGDDTPVVLLDPQTGSTLASMRVDPPAGIGVATATRQWGIFNFSAVDLDGAGGDELVLVLCDRESHPSVTYLIEPEARTARIVFSASGHHGFAGGADVDGDGRKELILVGSANRLGHHVGIAAVKVAEASANPDPIQMRGDRSPAVTPDQQGFDRTRAALAWYALGPPSRSSPSQAVTVDAKRRRLRVEGFSADAFELGFDGFRTDVPSAMAAGPRSEARKRAWELLGGAGRLADAGDLPAALAAVSEAEEAIRPAADPFLLGWVRRTSARLLVASGQPDRAEEIWRELAAGLSQVAPLSIEAGTAFHLHGDLTRALRWYEKAVFGNGALEEGWVTLDALEGGVLLLLERGDLDGARSLVERAPMERFTKLELEDLVSWRSGRRVPEREGPAYVTPIRRYWRLEERLAAGGGPVASLFAEARAEGARPSEARDLFALLEAEVLLREGRAAEAWDLAGPAFSSLWARRTRDVAARAHLGLAADRAARAAEAVGRRAEATLIRSDARRFLAAAR